MFARAIAVIVLLGSTSACSDQEYSLEVWNTSPEKVYEVEVWYGKKHAQFGVIPPGKSAIRNGMRTPPPEVAEIRWEFPKGEPHAVRIDISSLVPNRYEDGQLTFRIRPGNAVTAHYQKINNILF